VHSGSSYCSASDLALTFGLGKDASASAIEIDWPSGAKQKLTNIPANQRLTIQEQ
ncbi:ASPIC/UnbV domain-containing protein, partial [Klebsiella pneumoniae]|uniref:ASPIC/UnbV domain-containing protein n=1 Tax=Klebsiella pneumoniae TaxID=573 RepID=UPI003C6DA6D8